MVSIFSCSSLSLVNQSKARDEVFVASVPLRATKGPAQLLVSAAYNLHLWDLQHFKVIVKPAPTLNSQSQVQLLPLSFPDRSEKVCAFDFQPEDPENISTALAALSGRSIPGVVLARKMTRLPRRRCWFVGTTDAGAIDGSYSYSERWELDLHIGCHDCRDYTNGLVEHLTQKKQFLEQLRGTS